MANYPTRTIDEIMSWYSSHNPGVLEKLYRLLMHGRTGGSGKLVILPVDQGIEHGPGRSFAPNPAGYDPDYHFELGIQAGFSAYAAPLGFLEAGAAKYAGQIPLILKLNSHDVLHPEPDPLGAQTGSVRDALRLGCVGIGYTIYPGTIHRRLLYEQFRAIAEEAKAAGLLVVLWSYPRGGGLSKEGETAIDVIAYAAQLAAQFGAHLIKVKPPTAHIELDAARKVYEKHAIPVDALSDRIAHVVQSAFNGKRIVIFSGGAAKGDEAVFDEIRENRNGGGFGSIIGRNSFQRPWDEAITFVQKVMDIHTGAID